MIQISVARVSDLFLFNPTALSLPASLKKSSKENGLALTFFPLKTCGSPVTTVNKKWRGGLKFDTSKMCNWMMLYYSGRYLCRYQKLYLISHKLRILYHYFNFVHTKLKSSIFTSEFIVQFLIISTLHIAKSKQAQNLPIAKRE